MKVSVYQLNLKEKHLNIINSGQDEKFRDIYFNLHVGFDSEKQKESLITMIREYSDAVKKVVDLNVNSIDSVFKMTNNINESWNKILPKDSKYYGSPDGCKSTSVGDFLMVDNEGKKDFYLYAPSSLNKLDDYMKRELLVAFNLATKDEYMDFKRNQIDDWLDSSKNSFLYIAFNTLQGIIKEELKEKKPNINNGDIDFLSEVVAKRLIDKREIEIMSADFSIEKIKPVFDNEFEKLKSFNKKPLKKPSNS